MTPFAALHQPGNPLFLPNAWDYASAAQLHRAGYTTLGTTSLGVAAAAGKPDAAEATAAETVALTRILTRLPIQLTVDLENGQSDDPDEVAALAKELADLGAVGINIEDSTAAGTLISPEHHAAKIRAVKQVAPNLFVNARTDTYWLRDIADPMRETTTRVEQYLAAGADGIFIPGAADIPTVSALTEAIPAPINILYLPGKHTFRELAEANVARVSTGSLLFRTALAAAVETARAAHHDTVNPDPHSPTYAEIQATTSRQ